MAPNPIDLIRQQAGQLLERALRQVPDHPADLILDDERYRKFVINSAWNAMPLPVRLMGRQRLRFDDLLIALRDEAIIVEGTSVRVRPDLRRIVLDVSARILRGETKASGTNAATAPASHEDATSATPAGAASSELPPATG